MTDRTALCEFKKFMENGVFPHIRHYADQKLFKKKCDSLSSLYLPQA
ncbi:MAG: hypothetical protein HN417_12525 [Desulfobacula sp.]|nr:hypothetical protein [Desulfobacula sp.]